MPKYSPKYGLRCHYYVYFNVIPRVEISEIEMIPLHI